MKNKVLNVISKILTTILLILSVFVLLCTCLISVVSNTDDSMLLGYKPYIKDNDVIIVTKVNTDDINLGDYIVYHSVNPNHYNEINMGTIKEDTFYEDEKAYVTKEMDEKETIYPVKESNIVGIEKYTIPGLGRFLTFLLKPIGYILLVLLPFVLGVGIKVISIIKN